MLNLKIVLYLEKTVKLIIINEEINDKASKEILKVIKEYSKAFKKLLIQKMSKIVKFLYYNTKTWNIFVI